VAIAKHAALATASPYATRIGLSVLKRGGNAIDAAVAVAFALSVAEPQSGGIGGGGFLTYYDAEKRAVWTLDFREVAPGAATRNMFEGGASATQGPLAAGVPGTVAGLQAMHDRFGSRPWRELVMPAVGLTQGKKDLAATLERIAGKGATDVYEGETASRIVESVRKAGGIIGLRDLREYKPIWRAPIRITFREFDIYAVPPPSAAGLMIGEQLHILSAYDLRTTGDQTASTVHLLAEAARRAAIDRDRHLADPAALRAPIRELLSAERAKQWRASIDPLRVTPTLSLAEPATAIAEGTHTTHFTIADTAGNIAALTMSLGDDFGSGFLVPQCGFHLNNAMKDFTASNTSPNAIAAGKRMASSLAPTIILRRGQPYLALGTSGGAAIPSIVLQVFLGVTTFGKSLAQAVDAPRFDQQATPEDITCEVGKTPALILERLRGMGHGVRERQDIGDMHALLFETQRITAVSDSRRGGAAGGF
jgi:gamma-glutamyltranspeptidase/glutathione hydrolase